MVTHYHRLLPGAVSLLQSIHRFLDNQRKRAAPLEWTSDAVDAFQRVKVTLSQATQLTHPTPGTALSLQADASDSEVGAVLQQHVDGA